VGSGYQKLSGITNAAQHWLAAQLWEIAKFRCKI